MPPDPVLKYDQCATQVKSQANQNKWTVTLFQAISYGISSALRRGKPGDGREV